MNDKIHLSEGKIHLLYLITKNIDGSVIKEDIFMWNAFFDLHNHF